MNVIKKIFIPFILLGFILSSCVNPPKNAETKNFLPWLDAIIVKINAAKDNKKDMINLLKNHKRTDEILAFYKDNEINIYTKKSEKDSLIQTTDNNSIVVTKSIYITKIGPKGYISFDKENWILLGNRPGKLDKNNFDFNFNVETKLNSDNSKLDIYYTLSLDPKDGYKTVNLKVNKKVVEIEKNTVFFDKGMKKFIDLDRNILHIAENTSITGNIEITGNLVEAKTTDTNISFKSLKDVFVYSKDKPVSFSFDAEHWAIPKFPFKSKPSFIIKSGDNNNVIYDLKLNLNVN